MNSVKLQLQLVIKNYNFFMSKIESIQHIKLFNMYQKTFSV